MAETSLWLSMHGLTQPVRHMHMAICSRGCMRILGIGVCMHQGKVLLCQAAKQNAILSQKFYHTKLEPPDQTSLVVACNASVTV